MSIVVIDKEVGKEDIKKASEEYVLYIKIVVDIESRIIAIGGQWHADAENILIENGSTQKSLWGGGIDLSSKEIDYNALINIRPQQGNDSMEILDKEIKRKFEKIVKEKFGI